MLVTLSATLGLLASCSSTPVTDSAEVESSANNEAFSSLVNSDGSETGAVVDQSNPMLVADASSNSPTASDSSFSGSSSSHHSPVNLGASSAGRAH
jgi:hypothetical protein